MQYDRNESNKHQPIYDLSDNRIYIFLYITDNEWKHWTLDQ